MFNVFSTALSALNATSTAIDVTGNNLANMATSVSGIQSDTDQLVTDLNPTGSTGAASSTTTS